MPQFVIHVPVPLPMGRYFDFVPSGNVGYDRGGGPLSPRFVRGASKVTRTDRENGFATKSPIQVEARNSKGSAWL